MDKGNDIYNCSKMGATYWNGSSDEEMFHEPHVVEATPTTSDISPSMPAPKHSCEYSNCEDEFAIGYDPLMDNIKNTTTPIYRKQFENQNILHNTAKTFSESSQSLTQQSDISPTPTTSISCQREESGKDTPVKNDCNETDKDNFSSKSVTLRPRGTKKPLRGRDEWAHNKRKRLKNLGEEYCTKDGIIMPKKSIQPPCTCRFKCYEKITNTQRQIVFDKFWQLGDRQKQWTFLVKYVKKVEKNRTLNRDIPNNRIFTFKYYLPLAEPSDELQVLIVDVCKIMFLNTLVISDKMIRTAWEKYDGSTEVAEDRRGRHDNHKKILTENMIQSVTDHVYELASKESYNLGNETDKLYLDASMTIPCMFQLYNKWFDPERYTTKATTERQYREIVRKKMNVEIIIPNKDQSPDPSSSHRPISLFDYTSEILEDADVTCSETLSFKHFLDS